MDDSKDEVIAELRSIRRETLLSDGIELLTRNSRFVDCSLVAEGQVLQVHRLVLSALSPVFNRIFTQQQHIQHSTVILEQGTSFVNATRLLDYIYLGYVEIPDEEVEDFKKLLVAYELPPITALGRRRADSAGKAEKASREELTLISNCLPVGSLDQTDTQRNQSSQSEDSSSAINETENATIVNGVTPNEENENSCETSFQQEDSSTGPERTPRVMPKAKVLLTVNKNKVCQFCEKVLANQINRINHEAHCKHNPAAIGFLCEQCSVKCATQASLRRHLRSNHKTGNNKNSLKRISF